MPMGRAIDACGDARGMATQSGRRRGLCGAGVDLYGWTEFMSQREPTAEMVDAGVQALMRVPIETPLSYDEIARIVYEAMECRRALSLGEQQCGGVGRQSL
jgi:hypothetical protein